MVDEVAVRRLRVARKARFTDTVVRSTVACFSKVRAAVDWRQTEGKRGMAGKRQNEEKSRDVSPKEERGGIARGSA